MVTYLNITIASLKCREFTNLNAWAEINDDNQKIFIKLGLVSRFPISRKEGQALQQCD